jgi:hypothetical protein
MKDGIMDKLVDYLEDLNRDGMVCMVIGADMEALDQISCCDECKIKYLQQMCNQAAWDLLAKYRDKKATRGNH